MTAVKWGSPVESIVSYADDHRIDLIIIATHGRIGLEPRPPGLRGRAHRSRVPLPGSHHPRSKGTPRGRHIRLTGGRTPRLTAACGPICRVAALFNGREVQDVNGTLPLHAAPAGSRPRPAVTSRARRRRGCEVPDFAFLRSLRYPDLLKALVRSKLRRDAKPCP